MNALRISTLLAACWVASVTVSYAEDATELLSSTKTIIEKGVTPLSSVRPAAQSSTANPTSPAAQSQAADRAIKNLDRAIDERNLSIIGGQLKQ